MSSPSGHVFNLNGIDYDSTQLSSEGKQVFALLQEAQSELNQLDVRKALLQAAQQQLIGKLKPLLPAPIPSQPDGAVGILGHGSDQIPTTTVERPSEEPASFPSSIPEQISAS